MLVNNIKHPEFYKFEECVYCSTCDPNIEDEKSRPMACDRCLMGSEPDRFMPLLDIKTDRERELEEVLTVLLEPKTWKQASTLIYGE